jgi:hypothetical protein
MFTEGDEMKLLRFTLTAGAFAFGLALSARAADICVTDQSGREYRFEKPKLPKKPGKVFPLVGSVRTVPQIVDAFSWGPVQGSSMYFIGGPDLIVVAIVAQTQGAVHTARMTVDRTFSGTGLGDFAGDYSSNTALTWTAVDCDTSSLP